jgi:hypothetical protein
VVVGDLMQLAATASILDQEEEISPRHCLRVVFIATVRKLTALLFLLSQQTPGVEAADAGGGLLATRAGATKRKYAHTNVFSMFLMSTCTILTLGNFAITFLPTLAQQRWKEKYLLLVEKLPRLVTTVARAGRKDAGGKSTSFLMFFIYTMNSNSW